MSSSSTALLTARALILLQVLSRLLTFGLNQTLVRLAPPEVFGTAAIQFDLIYSTILFLSREGIRNALLRSKPTIEEPDASQEPKEQKSSPVGQNARLATIPFLFGLLISIGVLAVYLAQIPASTSSQSDFKSSLALYVLSALIELACEPHYIRAIRSTPPKLKVRLQAEGGMAIVKAIVTVTCVVLFDRGGQSRALLAFALGQTSGAIFLASRYISEYGLSGLFLVSSSKTGQEIDNDLRSLAIANTRQSFIKHLLTEGDRVAVGIICPLEDQGGYAIAMNYGSLIARILFQPLEETLLLQFTSSPPTYSLKLLSITVHISSHLLFLFPAFLPPLFPVILPFLLPRRYQATSAPQILTSYIQNYIPLLSLNGILESYHSATASPKDIKNQMRWMFGSSLSFIGSLWLFGNLDVPFLHQEETGLRLIDASRVSMIIRILYAYLYASRKSKEQQGTTGVMGMGRLIPDIRTLGTIGICGLILRFAASYGRWTMSLQGKAEMILLGGILGVGTLGFIYMIERRKIQDFWKSKKE